MIKEHSVFELDCRNNRLKYLRKYEKDGTWRDKRIETVNFPYKTREEIIDINTREVRVYDKTGKLIRIEKPKITEEQINKMLDNQKKVEMRK